VIIMFHFFILFILFFYFLHFFFFSVFFFIFFFFFFFNDPATPEIYTLSLHDALPISFCFRRPALRFGPAADFSVRCSLAARSAMELRRHRLRCRCRTAITASRSNVLPKSKARPASAKELRSSLIWSPQRMQQGR